MEKSTNENAGMYPRQKILGLPPSKSNSYEIIQSGGHASLAKTFATVKYERDFFMQCSLRNRNISVPFSLDIDIFFSSNRPDLDNALKVVLDCLQSCHVIKNDRLCSEIHARKLIDKREPRIEFTIRTLMQ